MLPAGVNGVVGGIRPVAKTGFFASAVSVGCCVYLPQVLVAGNNRIVGTSPALTANVYYGLRNNSNPFCNIPCPSDVLIATSGSTKNFVNGIGVLRLGDSIGVFGAIVIGIPSNTYCS